ncbi:MAG: hypothetical protein ACFFDF_00410 [Candidatus Odinarchaeota archaeon]
MEGLNENLNEGQENVVDSQIEESNVVENEQDNSNSESVNEEVATSQKNEKIVQDAETNAKFADVRRKTEQETRDKLISEMYGESHNIHTYADYQKALEKQKEDEEVKQYASNNYMTEDQARKELERDKEIQSLRQEVNKTKFMSTIDEQKKALKDKPFFSELESDIDNLIKDTINSGQSVDVETAYKYLCGEKLPELLENAKTNASKSTIADIQDVRRRGGVVKSDGGADDVDISDVDLNMAKAFGNDPKEIAKYVAKQKRR